MLSISNLDIYATEKDVKNWAKESGLPICEPKEILYSTSQDVLKINKEGKKYIHAATFFEFLGITKDNYFDIDKFAFDKPQIIHDLQYPIDHKFDNYFNFVIDSGTIEHIFDVKSVMENIVRVTKVGGYVLQIVPAQGFLNHGFYQFSPTLFYDFYTNNGFEVIESYVVEFRSNYYRFYYYNQTDDYTGPFLHPKYRLVNCFFLRKIKDIRPLVLPDQYTYQILATNLYKPDSYNTHSKIDRIVNHLRGIIPIKYHGLFFGFWRYLKRLTTKKDYFDIRI